MTAPNAPLLTSPIGATVVDRAITNRFTWTFSDPDGGDTQSAYDLRYQVVGAGSWTTVSATTPNNYRDITGSTFAAADYEWQARTTDALGAVGPYSASEFFTAADAPSAPTITAPLVDADVYNEAAVAWSTPSQTEYQVRRVGDSSGSPDTGTVYYDSGQVADAVARSLSVAFDVNNRYEHVQVRVMNSGLWSDWSSVRVFVSFVAPVPPTFTVTAEQATASLLVTVTNPADALERVNLVARPSFESADVTGWSATSETSDDLEAELLLRQAVLWLDAKYATSSQTVPNQGTGSTALDGTLGSTGGADSNDPKWLDFTGTPFVYVPGAASNAMSVPDAAALDITGDLTVYARAALDDWTPASIMALSSKFRTSTADRSWEFRVQTTGTIELITSADGSSAITHTSTAAPPLTDGTVYWLAATIDVDNGAVGHDVRFYYAADSETVPTSWTQIGTTVTTAGVTSLYSSVADVMVGSTLAGTTRNAAGKFYRAIVASGIGASGVPGGTTVLDVDTSVLTSGAATSFTESSSNAATVTINRSTSGRKAVAVVGNCWLLGTDDYLEVADNALLDFGASDDFTVLAVVRQWATQANFVRIVSKKDGSGAGWDFLTGDTGSNIQLDLVDSGARSASRNDVTRTMGALSAVGMVGDRTAQTVRLFNGSTLGATASISTITDMSNALALRVGARAGTITQCDDMELTAVAVFRSALTSDQIAQLNTYFQARAALATAAPSRSTTSPQSGTHVGVFANTAGYPTRGAVYTSAAVVAGTAYTGSLYARGGTASARAVIDWYSGSTYLSRSTGTAAALTSSMQRYSATGTAPVGATHARLRLDSATNTATLDVDAALIEAGAELGSYFDGDSEPDATHSFAWDGTAHESTSTAPSRPTAASNAIYLRLSSDTGYGDRMANGLTPNTAWRWWVPASGVDYEARVLTTGANGTTVWSEYVWSILSDGGAPSTVHDTVSDGGAPSTLFATIIDGGIP